MRKLLLIVKELVDRRPATILVVVVLLATFWGLDLVYHASSYFYFKWYRQDNYLLLRQITGAVTGVIVFILIQIFNYNSLGRSPYKWWLSAALLIVFLVNVPGCGVSMYYAKRWIRIWEFCIETGFWATVFYLIYISAFFSEGAGEQDVKRTAIAAGALFALIFLLVIQPDLTLAFVILLTTVFLLYVTGNTSGVIVTFLAGALPFVFFAFRHRDMMRQRLSSLLLADPYGASYQVIQSIDGFIRGGLFGAGSGARDMYLLPDVYSGYIYSFLGERFGLAGAVLAALIFLLLFYLGLKASVKSSTRFGALLTLSFTAMLTMFAFTGMGTAAGLLPPNNEGIPFLGYDKRLLILGLITVGLIFKELRGSGNSENLLGLKVKPLMAAASVLFALPLIKVVFHQFMNLF